jgi:hypothetical protein
MRRSTLSCSAFAILLTCALGGCATHQAAQPVAAMGDLGPQPAVLSLGAGDSLGRAVYVNDLIIAAAELDKSTTYTNVDQGMTEILMDR